MGYLLECCRAEGRWAPARRLYTTFIPKTPAVLTIRCVFMCICVCVSVRAHARVSLIFVSGHSVIIQSADAPGLLVVVSFLLATSSISCLCSVHSAALDVYDLLSLSTPLMFKRRGIHSPPVARYMFIC